jgi:uncharacterized protein (DUF1015 family)
MSTIRPLPAIRYQTAPGQLDLSARIAPPYDVLDAAGKQALLDQDSQNFVAIDLPHMPPKSAGPDELYTNAAQTLHSWLADGTMVRDSTPQIYVYHQDYVHHTQAYTRKMFFARLHLEAFGSGSVFPHEHTFGGPKEDRLALTKATQANLSPIFGLYEDARNDVSQVLEAALPKQPIAKGTLDAVDNTMWAISDPGVIAQATEMLQSKPIYIADGHHRYGTALLYRDWLASEQGPLPDNHPANFVLCVFCAMEDPGLLILPTHRVLTETEVAVGSFESDDNVTLTNLTATDPDAAVTELAQHGPMAVALHEPNSGKFIALKPTRDDVLDDIAPDHSPAWRRLGLAFLHAYLLDRIVSPRYCDGNPPVIQYVKSAAGALDVAKRSQGSAFLMQPTTMEEMRDVCSAGDLMPQKSTFFFPKLASGLIVNPLTE